MATHAAFKRRDDGYGGIPLMDTGYQRSEEKGAREGPREKQKKAKQLKCK